MNERLIPTAGRRRFYSWMIGALALLVAGMAYGQATQTGSITGVVRTADGMAVPGVTVTANSTTLQGDRVTYSGESGAYVLRGLPPGMYTVEFSMSGMGTIQQQVRVDLGAPARIDATMSVSMAEEAITVTAEAPIALNTTQLGSNMKSEEITTLPLPRTLAGIAALSPGVNTNTFNAGQVRINGAMAFDNVFLVDGTDVNDNLFGTAHNLYIEEAIAETQVMTGGVSAEYGRFTGGVVNVVTKSGGNDFTGTLRADLTNPDWIAVTDFEKSRGIEHADQISEIYSATFGGPVVHDRLWFFLAGRQQESSEQRTLVETSVPYQFGVENPRYEIKVTATPLTNHTFQASWLDNETTQANNIGLAGRTMDPRALVTRTLPNDRWAVFYNGILSPNLFAEVKYSEKTFGFRNTGGTSTEITDSPFLTTNSAFHFNAPYFDSTDPEDRNNEDLTASLSYFLDTKSLGTHDLKVGFEEYTSSRTGGNSQSSTGYVFFANFARNADGSAMVDSSGRFVPQFVPGTSRVINYMAVRGAQIDLTTTSFFVNDNWTPNQHLSFNIGARFEGVDGEATGGIKTVESDRITPRIAGSWDIRGNGRQKVDLTYAQYSGKYNERQFAVNTNVGTPNSLTMSYTGPAGEGIGFAPGFDIANYSITTGSFPLQNIRVDPGIESALVDEWTISGGTQIGSRGFAKLSFTNREWSDFWEDYLDTTTGTTEVVISPTIRRVFNNVYYSNNNESWREYQALQILSQFRLLSRWNLTANYTHELRNHGNFIGEAGNQPGNASPYGDYPELYSETRHYPEGRMPGFQEHRLRVMNTWDQPLGAFGKLNFGLIYGYDSAGVYNLSTNLTTLTAEQNAIHAAAGYISRPSSQTIYFGKLGTGEFEDVHQFDLALTYAIPVFGSLEPWLKLDVYNILNSDALVQFNTQVSADPNSPKDALGLPTGYIPAANFGRPTSVSTQNSPGHIQLPREIRVSAGIRF